MEISLEKLYVNFGAWSSAKRLEDTLSEDRGPFLKVPIINKTEKLLLFKFKIEVSIVFVDNMIKLSVSNKKKGRALIL